MSGSDVFRMLKCLGCDSIRLRHDWHNADTDDSFTYYYPPAQARSKPRWLREMQYQFVDPEREIIANYLREIYSAIHSESRRLPAIGIRALLEHVMIKKTGDRGSFGGNLEAFLKAGYVSQAQADFLRDTLEAGHASTHRSWEPSEVELNALMDVCESIVETVYVLGEKLKAVKVPPRLKQ